MEAKLALGEPRVLISRQAILHNARVIRQSIGPGVKLCAMVKADAYGHGAKIVADTLCHFDGGDTDGFSAPAADQLGVATIEEAAALPLGENSQTPVLIFRPVENVFLGRQREAIELAVRRGWVLTVITSAAADDLNRVAQSINHRARVQVMVDTGISRCGTSLDSLEHLLGHIASRPGLRLVGVSTHFASSEEADDPFNREQLRRFREATDRYAQRDPRLIRHTANSGAIFFAPDAHLDMVRPGIALYGVDPTGTPNIDRALKPVMRWTAPLLMIRDLPAGASVGYGQTWTAKSRTRVGLVPVGYADGYPRMYSNRAAMSVLGKLAPVLGRVSMDLTVIDLTRVPQAVIGDEVTVMDNDPMSAVSVYQLAEWAETIPYEVFCRIGPRVKRVSLEQVEDVEPIADSSANDET
ncbi:MAG: alanine racemase [Phycisphaerae bacterium]|nr:alanine racemase [Phycisphaerae bacterium]